jgi:hypothetical protein
MANELKQSGHYKLESFKIKSFDRQREVDIKFLIHTFNIVESMSAGSVRGSAVVYDSNDLINTLPLKSEEIVEITYSDFFDEVRTDQFFLYSITDVSYAKENSQAIVKYTINFVSIPKLLTENERVAKAYKYDPVTSRSLISDYANTVYDEYYSRPLREIGLTPKEIIVEPTTGDQALVVTRMTPEQTMHFFSRKAYSQNSRTQSFRFFETRDKYFFVTNDYMTEYYAKGGIGYLGNSNYGLISPSEAASVGLKPKTIRRFGRNYALDKSPERQLAAMYELIEIDFGTRNDTIDDINRGAYKKASYEIDLINGTFQKIAYDHAEEYEDETLVLPHNKPFINERITKERERFIIKDYASTGAATGTEVGSNKFYPELHNKKTTYFYHYEKNSIRAKIYGRNDLFAGDVIELDLISQADGSGKNEKDIERSGLYLIESIENNFYENTYTQKLVLSRSGIGSESRNGIGA